MARRDVEAPDQAAARRPAQVVLEQLRAQGGELAKLHMAEDKQLPLFGRAAPPSSPDREASEGDDA